MKKLLIISLFIFLSSCSILEKAKNNIEEDTKLKDTNIQNQEPEKRQTNEEKSLKDIEQKGVIDTNLGGDINKELTSTESTASGDIEEEEIVKEFENELDDLFNSLEGYDE